MEITWDFGALIRSWIRSGARPSSGMKEERSPGWRPPPPPPSTFINGCRTWMQSMIITEISNSPFLTALAIHRLQDTTKIRINKVKSELMNQKRTNVQRGNSRWCSSNLQLLRSIYVLLFMYYPYYEIFKCYLWSSNLYSTYILSTLLYPKRV